MKVTARAVARGLARSASTVRRIATSSATESATAASTRGRPGPRRRAARIRVATTRSAVASSRSSANARSAASVVHRACSRADNVATSLLTSCGQVRVVAVIACSRPTPTTSTSARRRVHSSTASSRSIPAAAAVDVDSRIGRPQTVIATMAAATGIPVASHTATPAVTATKVRHPARFLPDGHRRRGLGPAAWLLTGAGSIPATAKTAPAVIATPASAASSPVMAGSQRRGSAATGLPGARGSRRRNRRVSAQAGRQARAEEQHGHRDQARTPWCRRVCRTRPSR